MSGTVIKLLFFFLFWCEGDYAAEAESFIFLKI